MERKDEEYLSDSQRLLSDSPEVNYRSIPPVSQHPSNQYSTMAVPRDRFHVIYIIFYVLGLGTLLPWNFFITANDYWMYKLSNGSSPTPPTSSPPLDSTETPSNSTSPTPSPNQMQVLFQNSLSLCAMLPSVIFQFLNTLLQERVAERVRMITSLIIIAVVFIITAVLVPIDVSEWQETFFALTMICVVVINSSVAVFQSSLFGMASKLPSLFMQALMAGQGMGGLFAAIARIVALALSPDPVSSALAYFVTAIAVVIIIGFCYLHLPHNAFYAFHSSSSTTMRRPSVDLQENNKFFSKYDPPHNRKDSDENKDVWERRVSNGGINDADYLNKVKFKKPSPPFKAIFKKIWVHCFCIFFIFFITLACFPSLTASVKSVSQNESWRDLYFVPVACFLLFNLTDWIGRTAAGYIHFPSHSNLPALVVCVLARAVFPALFALCNVQPRTSPVLFGDDVYFIVFMVLFGASNGYLSTLVMQYGPKRVDLDHAATAGSMMALVLSVGLAAGAGFSFVIKLAI